MRLHTLQLLIEGVKKILAALVSEYNFKAEKEITNKDFTKISVTYYDINKKSD